jgi:hypothetical protein
MAYGVILTHLEVDKITWRCNFLKKNFFKGQTEGRRRPFRGQSALFLTGVENTGIYGTGHSHLNFFSSAFQFYHPELAHW